MPQLAFADISTGEGMAGWLERAAEECAWGAMLCAFALSVAITCATLYWALVERWAPAVCAAALYGAWFVVDRRTPWLGGRRSGHGLGSGALRWLHARARSYFPVTLEVDRVDPGAMVGDARMQSSASVAQDSLIPLGATLEHEVSSSLLHSAGLDAVDGSRAGQGTLRGNSKPGIGPADEAPAESQAAIVCCHPHGVWPFGMLGAFLFGGADGALQTPSVVLTLGVQFAVPLWREVVLAAGLAVADADTIASLLRGGTSVVLSLGGASEATLARPGVMEVVVRRRRGVFRLALQTGCALRPALSLHEHDLYWQARWAWLRPLQRMAMRLTGLPIPMLFFARRSVLGLVPGRGQALPVVLGAPVAVDRRIAHPTDADIAALAQRYTAALVALHARHSRGASVLVIS